MFDEQSAAAAASSMNPAAASAAAALTLVALNTAGGATAGSSAGPPIASATPILQQQQQQQQLAQLLTGKDSRWLQLEVCREYQRGQCTRSELDCKYAHPPPHVEVQNGKVTACYDSIKGRCTRENPRCKYLHPPQHLKDQLLANGKQNLVMKNLISQQLSQQQQCQPAAMPALAQIVHHPGAPMALQSAALPFPYFIPGLFPGPAGALLPQADPFAALQNTFQLTEHQHLQANGTSSYLAKRPKGENGTGNVGQQNGAVVSTAAGLSAAAVAGMPWYTAAPQFNPYLVPTAQFLPAVSFAGQLPPRF